MSTVIGGGIVAVPFGFQQMGVYLSFFILAFVCALQCNCSWLYLKAKDLIDGKPESVYEIGYMLYSRSSIFIISVIYSLNSFGLCMVYFITFAETVKSICRDALGLSEGDPTPDGFKGQLVSKQLWVLVLAVFMLPVCLKKELQELHAVSISLFVSIMIFIFIVFLQLCVFGTDKFSNGTEISFKEFQKPSVNSDFYTWVKSICCFLVAFSFTTNLFPLFSALKVKTNENCQKAVNYSLGICFFIYSFLAVVGCLLFGGQITLKSANIMLNINEEFQVDPNRWESFIIRALFMIVLACHIPFIFFSGKEGMLIIIDELDRKSISKTLDDRVKTLRGIETSNIRLSAPLAT